MKLLSTMLVLSCAIAMSAQQPSVTFTDATCGISFQYPADWTVVRNADGIWSADYKGNQVACTVGLRPPHWNDVPEFPTHVAVIRRPFREVAQRAGFTHDDGDWTIAVRQGNAPAEQFRTTCCQVIIGETWGNGTAADGSKTTIVATLAVVNDRRRHTALIEGEAAVVKQIAKSVTFGAQ
jgi:hypothetical protein